MKTELSPEIARYVLAQRTGVEDYHDVEVEHNSALQAINAFGAREDLFGKRKVENVLILVEGQDAECKIVPAQATGKHQRLIFKQYHFSTSPPM